MSDTTPGAASAGALLRAAREKQGLHIAALAAAIKVAPRKLDALENDRWDELPDATFTRALAQTVCRSLKIEARPVLDLLPQPAAVALEPANGVLNEPFHERPGRSEPGLAGAAVRPMVWAALAFMLAAVAVYFMPEGLWTSKPAAPAAAPTATVTTPIFPPLEAASAPVIAATADAAPSAPASASALAATASPASASASAAVPTAAAAPAAPSPAPAATNLVQLRTRAASWIEARDSRGQLLLSRTVVSGEAVGLDGSLPIRLLIGNASATQLVFRGEAVDLAPRTRDNVARVELQ